MFFFVFGGGGDGGGIAFPVVLPSRAEGWSNGGAWSFAQ